MHVEWSFAFYTAGHREWNNPFPFLCILKNQFFLLVLAWGPVHLWPPICSPNSLWIAVWIILCPIDQRELSEERPSCCNLQICVWGSNWCVVISSAPNCGVWREVTAPISTVAPTGGASPRPKEEAKPAAAPLSPLCFSCCGKYKFCREREVNALLCAILSRSCASQGFLSPCATQQ